MQTYSNIEIIVVNDGSTDKSAKVIAKFAAADSRIKYLEQENKGVSNARNHALDVALSMRMIKLSLTIFRL